MFTIVTIYNKKDVLERVLLKSLQKQTVPFELITIDNTAGKYKSAAAAFNAEAPRATGEYILFVHQDVDFGEDTEWLREVEKYITTLKNPGIVGFAGFDFEGNFRGHLSSCGADTGKQESNAVDVQTLDGFLFIVPKKVFARFSFDEKTFDGWHLYADDYCLTTQQHEYKSYVIPFFTYHRSFSINNANLIKYKRRFFFKYGARTFTSIGTIDLKFLIKSFVQQLIEPTYNLLFPDWIPLLKKEADGSSSLLDLECGCNSPVYMVRATKKVGVEENEKNIEESRKKGIHQEYVRANILDVTFSPRSFEIVFTFHTIEHLNMKEREALLDKMQIWTEKKVIIVAQNDPEMSRDLRRRGFRLYGMGGFKFLRTASGGLKYRPWYLFVILSDLSQKITFFFPSLASQILAVKDMAQGIN